VAETTKLSLTFAVISFSSHCTLPDIISYCCLYCCLL